MLQKLRLQNFRNFDEKLLELSEGVTVIVGPNASGKTNILESIFLMATGKSFKAKLEEEMIQNGEELARAKARVPKGDLEIVLTRGSLEGVSGKVSRKKFLVNGVGKRMIDFAGNFKAVLFGPWDMELVTESPSTRRKFLDFVLIQIDREYRRTLLSYEKGLRQRNRLLFRIREEGISRSQLLFWDKLLIKNGDYISSKREEFINFVNKTKSVNKLRYKIEYDKSAISEGRLVAYANEEVAAATTLVGPHRDDFIFKSETRELARFGSRGEQRMAILWLKLAEMAYIEEKSGDKPTLLLDDIFSELDHSHRDQVMKVAKKQQTIITTADPHFIVDSKGFTRIQL